MAGDASRRGAGALADTDAARLHAVIAPFVGTAGALLPVLHAVQAAFGHIDDAAVVVIAEQLNLSRADVHGVLTFYHDFRRQPAGRTVLRICRAEACQAMGSDALIAHAEHRLAMAIGSTRADGAISLEPVYCLGLCSAAPSAMIDGRIVARLSPQRLDALLAGAIS
jgi:formate dehydrogenase subunit gamma